MIQLDFDAATRGRGAGDAADEVGYSQHDRRRAGRVGRRPSSSSSTARTRSSTRPRARTPNYFSSQLFLGRSAHRASAATTPSARRATLRPVVALVPDGEGRLPGRRTRGSASSATGASSTAASTTARPGPTRSAVDEPDHVGGDPVARRRPSPSRPAARSAPRRPTSSAARSRQGRASSRRPSPTRRTSSSRSAACSSCCSGSPRGRAGTSPRRSGSPAGARGARSSPRRFSLYWAHGRALPRHRARLPAARRPDHGASSTCSSGVGPLDRLVDTPGSRTPSWRRSRSRLGLFFTIVGLTSCRRSTALAMVELDEGREVTALGAYRLVAAEAPAAARRAPPRRDRDRDPRPHPRRVSSASGSSSAGCCSRRSSCSRTAERPLRRSAQLVRGHWWLVASITWS